MSGTEAALDVCSSEGSQILSVQRSGYVPTPPSEDPRAMQRKADEPRKYDGTHILCNAAEMIPTCPSHGSSTEEVSQGSETDHPVSSRRPGKRVTHVTSTADALDLQTVPRRFNTSDVPNLCIQVQTIRSAQQPQVSRSDIKAPHSPSASVPFTGRHVKDAKRRDNKRVRDAEREARVKQNEQDRQAKSAEKRVRGAHATGEIRVCIDSRLASLKHGKAIVAALGTSEVEYRYEMKLGELEKWSTLIWYRDVGTGSANVQIAYVMVVMTGRQGEELLSCTSNVQEMMRTVLKAFGPVTLSLLFLGIERYLMAKERADYRSVASGQLGPTDGFSARSHTHTLLSLHFWAEGIVYRDCNDAGQAAEHVVGVTTAIALQPYMGGEDHVAAFSKKKSGALLSAEGYSDLPAGKRQILKALAGAAGLGPMSAKAITCQYDSVGAIMQNLRGPWGKIFCDEAANLSAGGRRVGPAAVKRLKWLLTSEDPDGKAI